eukprot:SAG31_NODE_12_length_38498_cov_21.161671_18_plen_225_part_00
MQLLSIHQVGKWHLGFYTEAHCPWRRGFGNGPHGGGGSDYGYLGGEEDYYTHRREPGYDFRKDSVPDHQDATTPTGSVRKYSTALFEARALDIVTNHSRDYATVPLFLYLPFQAVHAPLQSTLAYQSQFDLRAFENDTARWTYAAMVLEMDAAVGQVVDAFRNTGLYNNTIFIATSDNGGILPGGYNWPLRGQKATLWEGECNCAGDSCSTLQVQAELIPPFIG